MSLKSLKSLKSSAKFITGRNKDMNENLGILQRAGHVNGLDGGSSFRKGVDAIKRPHQEKKKLAAANTVHKVDNTNLDKTGSDYIQDQIKTTGRDTAQIMKDADYQAISALKKNNQGLMDENAKNILKTSYLGAAKEAAGHAWRGMNTGTNTQVAAKWGLAAGAYAGVNGVGRALTGGDATTNSSGQRDIMGIPFV